MFNKEQTLRFAAWEDCQTPIYAELPELSIDRCECYGTLSSIFAYMMAPSVASEGASPCSNFGKQPDTQIEYELCFQRCRIETRRPRLSIGLPSS
jgi:hypothetical protein